MTTAIQTVFLGANAAFNVPDLGSQENHTPTVWRNRKSAINCLKVFKRITRKQWPVDDQFDTAKVENSELRVSMKAFKAEARTLLTDDIFDEEAFVALRAKYQDSFEQRALNRAKTKYAVIQVFTEEQKEKWQAGWGEPDGS